MIAINNYFKDIPAVMKEALYDNRQRTLLEKGARVAKPSNRKI